MNDVRKMSGQHRMQFYMDKHRITPLFEDLMNRVLHDQPDDPIVYLIRALYKKAGLPVPMELKGGGVRKNSPERPVRSSQKSPDPATRKSSSQAWAIGSGPDLVARDYEKPWLKNSRKSKSKKLGEAEVENTAVKKQAQGWISDKKVIATSFDELFEQSHTVEKPVQAKKEETVQSSKVNAGEFTGGGYTGPKMSPSQDDDPLAGEIRLASGTDSTSKESTQLSMGHHRKPKLEAQRHRAELEQLLHKKDLDKASTDSGYIEDLNAEEEDDAIELLEDPDDLIREGVTKVTKGGYRLSRALKQRIEEPQVKLNINLYTGDRPYDSCTDEPDGQSPYYESDVERPSTGMSSRQFSPQESEEEFESVSQVTGPRRPVWNVPDSEVESYLPKVSHTLPEPTRRNKLQPNSTSDKVLAATMPVRFEDPYPRKIMDSSDSFLKGGKTWTMNQAERKKEEADNDRATPVDMSLKSQEGGWKLPDDTDTSMTTEQTERETKVKRRPPKAY
ncbi:hypothetical protein CHS0354_000922 [Potamilus streckersoni]|uniref:Uncharacterized protein n=1 Tax=Potamilus streckersoni TaxID=2493646 RepID=A0AAE0T5T6_9BIVA|nr:hypothetical protein CHS0354_000922 [Potamilus streckersoni]